MKAIAIAIWLLAAVNGAAYGQAAWGVIPANAPKIEVKGRIESMSIVRGQGMPSMVVKTADGNVRVLLGSMRYLVERDFNPKAGDEVRLTGFKVDDEVFAASVTLVAEGKTLQLRDDEGRPLWIGGRFGRGGAGRGRGGW